MEHWVYESYEMEHYWIDLLLMANHEDRKFPVNKRVVTIKAGQLMTSYRKLAVRWNVCKDTVKDILTTFEKEGMIIREFRDQSTVITIVNYGVYQGFKGKSADSDPDTDSDTISDTDPDTLPDTTADTESTQTRMEKNVIKNDIKNSKKPASQVVSPWGGSYE